MPKGKFIVFEGIDGSGKDTQLDLLQNALRSKNILLSIEREPSNGPIGSLIRSEYLCEKTPIDEISLRMLFCADCRDHITSTLIPSLWSGTSILCSRYYHSNIAYGSLFMQIEDLIDMNFYNYTTLKPDLTIIFDLDPNVAIKRIKERGTKLDRYEWLGTLTMVRESYLDLPELLREEEFLIVDSAKEPDEIFSIINQRVMNIIGV